MIEVRRGADARVSAAEEMSSHLKQEMSKLEIKEEEATQRLGQYTRAASLKEEAEEKANRLASLLSEETSKAKEIIHKYKGSTHTHS